MKDTNIFLFEEKIESLNRNDSERASSVKWRGNEV